MSSDKHNLHARQWRQKNVYDNCRNKSNVTHYFNAYRYTIVWISPKITSGLTATTTAITFIIFLNICVIDEISRAGELYTTRVLLTISAQRELRVNKSDLPANVT